MSELEISELIMGENMLFLEKFTPLVNFFTVAGSEGRDKSQRWETSTEQPILVPACQKLMIDGARRSCLSRK